MIDYHIHSDISVDCETDMMKMAAAADRKGLKEICFTEHIDLDIPLGFRVDFNRYDKKIAEVKSAYPGINISRGIEAGLGIKTKDKTKSLISSAGLDYVIGSQHLISGLDPFEEEIWQKYSQKEVYGEYLKESIENASACDFFDVFGHIGYVAKCCPHIEKVLRYSDYPDEIDTLLRILIQHGKGIEVNTSGLVISGSTLPETPIIKRYIELGGEIITVGSDAHREDAVGRSVKKTIEVIKDTGFKYICVFDERKPRFLQI
jgi:histidinol-phosphatase (PHP family)